MLMRYILFLLFLFFFLCPSPTARLNEIHFKITKSFNKNRIGLWVFMTRLSNWFSQAINTIYNYVQHKVPKEINSRNIWRWSFMSELAFWCCYMCICFWQMQLNITFNQSSQKTNIIIKMCHPVFSINTNYGMFFLNIIYPYGR